MSDFEKALAEFRSEMLSKFWVRDKKHGAKSIVRMSDKEASAMQGLHKHFYEEVWELCCAPDDTSEMVDVANMCFALWWRAKSRGQK